VGIVPGFDYFYFMTCQDIFWLCAAVEWLPAQGTGLFLQRGTLCWQVNRNPISLPEIAIQYIHLMTLQIRNIRQKFLQTEKANWSICDRGSGRCEKLLTVKTPIEAPWTWGFYWPLSSCSSMA